MLRPEVTGLAVPVQAGRVVVTHRDESRSHVVVWSADPAARLPTDDLVARVFPVEFVSCVRSDAPGAATVSCANADEATLFSAASAAATLKRSWGWDDSATIVVRLTAGQTFSVDPRFDGQAWNVTRSGGV